MHATTDPTTDDSIQRRRHLILAAREVITVTAWRDKLIEAHPDSTLTASVDTLRWWTPVLGPTCTLMAHRFAELAADERPHTFTADELAATFGIGQSSGRLRASLNRLDRFGAACVYDGNVAIRLSLPPLGPRQLRVLPGYLAVAYRHRS